MSLLCGLQDVVWATCTGVLGWSVLGIWHKGADGTDVNTCDRSPTIQATPQATTGAESAKAGDEPSAPVPTSQAKCLATGDDRGLVSLYRYPALGCKARVYGGHSSHVTTVRFSPDGRRLYSAGGGDACIMEWTVR